MKKSAPVFLVVVLVASALPAAAGSRSRSNLDPPIISWQPPASYSMALAGGRTALAEIGNGPVPFFPVTPCRQYDSRDTTPLAHNTPLTVALSGAPCGIPSATNAIAVNITIFNISGATGNGVFWVDTVSPPTVAWINYPPTEAQRGNAGVVTVNSGALVVRVNQGAGSVDFVVDVFGYYPNTSNSRIPTGDFFPIWGDYSGGQMILGRNDQATGANSYGVSGWTYSTGTGSAGIDGRAFGTTGAVFGVLGRTSSTSVDSAGVKGTDSTVTGGTLIGFSPAGVRGDSVGSLGVLGISQYIGVGGLAYNSSGAFLAAGYLGSTFGVATDTATGPWGVFAFGNLGAAGAKHFVEPHPTDPSKVIVYSSLEGREVGTYFRGTAHASGGTASIQVPEDFGIVTDEEGLTVQLTPVGGWAQMYVESQDLRQIVIRSSRDVTFHYLVQGVRRAFKGFAPVGNGYEFTPRSADARMPAYLTDEAKRRLIANGTYNSDGTVNTGTAERLGWTKLWAERSKAKEASKSDFPQQ